MTSGGASNRNLKIWAAVVAISLWLLWMVSAILLPFLAAIAIAYFLDPVADWLERRGLPRLAAVILITVTFVLFAVGTVLLLGPLMLHQAATLIDKAPVYYEQLAAYLRDLRSSALGDLLTAQDGLVGDAVSNLREGLMVAGEDFLNRVISGSLGFLNLVGLMTITPIVAFYLLLEWDDIVAKVDSYLPREHAPTIRSLARQIDKVISGYARGMASVCLLLAVFYGAALTAVGLDYGLVVGVIAGLLSFIPYFGAVAGFLASGILALLQFWDQPLWIAGVVGIFVFGQIIEGNFITPRLVGQNVGLHPVWIIFALLAFGSLFGFTGLLLAVPIAATIGVLVRYGLSIYLDSKLYLGRIDPAALTLADAMADSPARAEEGTA